MKTRAIRAARHVERKRRRQSKAARRANRRRASKAVRTSKHQTLCHWARMERIARLNSQNSVAKRVPAKTGDYPLLLIDRAKIHEWTGRVLTKDEPMEATKAA